MSYTTGPESMGFKKGERAALLRLLKAQFPHVPPEDYAEKLNQPEVNADTLLRWIQKILKAKTLEEVFEEDRKDLKQPGRR